MHKYYKLTFYCKHKLNVSDYEVSEAMEYDKELLTNYYKKDLDYNNNDELSDKVRETFLDNLSYYNTYYEPLVFNAEIALECGLLPFTYKGIMLLALSEFGTELSPRLDAYKVLCLGKIDKNNKFFLVPNPKYFEHVVGKGIMNKMKEVLSCNSEQQI